MAETAVKKRRKAGLERSGKKKLFYCLLLAWPVAQFLIFYVYVNVNSIMLAFRHYDYGTGKFAGFDLESFKQAFRFFGEPTFKYAIRNSFLAYAVGLFISTPLTFIFAYYMYKKMLFHRTFKVLLFMPSIVPAIVMVLIFKYFAEDAYPEIALKVFKAAEPQGLLANYKTRFATIIFYNVWSGFGIGVIMYVSAMFTINDSVVEAARIDGAGVVREFFHVTFPAIYPTFVTFTVLGVAGLFTGQLGLFSFYGESAEVRNYTVGYYLFREVRRASLGRYPYLASLGIIFTVILAPATFLVRYLLEKFGFKE